MDFLLKIAKPDFSIFTKLDLIHLENFSKKEDILNEKMKLILNTKNKAHLNYEDFYQKEISTALKIPFEFYNKKRLLTSYDSVLNQVQDDGSK
ncbi:MAG: hypothetical protein LBQ59_05505 [Candidatus Peribacteria bacterium]|jgi:UDP-N-acetylmuramyl pentapeptide synthase|nr:hypothetical protein [Candidatus Peribacteria bacterium]